MEIPVDMTMKAVNNRQHRMSVHPLSARGPLRSSLAVILSLLNTYTLSSLILNNYIFYNSNMNLNISIYGWMNR
jgi:hypothetical protein